VPTLQWLLS